MFKTKINIETFKKVYLFSQMDNHFSSQNCVSELLYVECAIVTTPRSL